MFGAALGGGRMAGAPPSAAISDLRVRIMCGLPKNQDDVAEGIAAQAAQSGRRLGPVAPFSRRYTSTTLRRGL